MSIEIAIPYYNEEQNIFKLIKLLKNKINRNYKKIIIDDCQKI